MVCKYIFIYEDYVERFRSTVFTLKMEMSQQCEPLHNMHISIGCTSRLCSLFLRNVRILYILFQNYQLACFPVTGIGIGIEVVISFC